MPVADQDEPSNAPPRKRLPQRARIGRDGKSYPAVLGTVDDFAECCETHAWFVHEGWITLQTAADNLQWLAERWDLIEEAGQDYIQQTIAAAFVQAYTPKIVRAAEAIKANPQKSDRAIAAELGVGKDTVRRARDQGGACAPPEAEERVGRDGKSYPAAQPSRQRRGVPQATRDAFKYVVGLGDRERLASWLRSHRDIARELLDEVA
jgi:hypothetical protein